MRPALALLRPHQWIKNFFVFAGLLFGHAWHDPVKVTQAIAAFVAFCLLASAVYVLNDLVDREHDRQHPEKKTRPIAAGLISIPFATALGLACLVGGLALAWSRAGMHPWIFLAYLLLNIGYSFWFKHLLVIDVLVICAGFMLRLLAGTLGLGIPPSSWLLLCGLWLTLFLGFAKRRAELAALGVHGHEHRRVLAHYDAKWLDRVITLAALGTVGSYALYTISPGTVALHGTHALIFTLPPVAYGVYRYRWRLNQAGTGGDPARTTLTDPHLLGASVLWLALVVVLLS